MPPGPTSRRLLPPPERRRRVDVVVAAGLAVAVAVVWTVLWATSPHHGTVSTPAAAAVPAPPDAGGQPAGFTEAWRAASGATPAPVVAGPVVVTGDGDAVTGRDAVTGEARWSYTRDVPLCTVGAGFPDNEGGRALALYRNGTWCSELTSLHPDTGTRDRQRNPDVRPGTRLLDGGSLVTATGPTYLEVFRSDLVRTVEYGDVPTPRQVGRQPRPNCESTGFAATSGRLAVLQRCPDEPADRLTVLIPDGAEADKPQEEFSVPLEASGTPVSNATLVAVSDDRVAVALPDPPRLEVLDRSGIRVGLIGLDVPATDLARPPADGVAAVTTDDDRVYWWTGSRTVALDAVDLTPDWTLPDTLGPGITYAGELLVPVPAGLAVVAADTGRVTDTLPVPRDDPRAPVFPAVQGEMLLEQRGPELVALRPSP
jgi:PQQ-like domain